MGKRVAATASVPVLRMAHPLAFSGFLKSIGAPVGSAFRRARLPQLCEDPNSYVLVKRAMSFYDDMARREVEALGWETGIWAHEEKINKELLKHLAQAPTLGIALQDFSALVAVEHSHIRLGLTASGEDMLFWLRNGVDADTPGYHIAQSYSLMVMLALLRHFIGASWLPEEVGIEALSVAQRVMTILPGTRFRVAQKAGYIRFPRVLLSLPPEQHWSSRLVTDKSGTTLSLNLIDRLDLSESLQLVLESYLAEGCPSVEQAAELLDTSERTLRRRLKEEGITYSKLVDRLRLDLAKRLLKDPDNKIIDISYDLGYSDPAHFTRSFHRMTGMSPSAYRHLHYESEESAGD